MDLTSGFDIYRTISAPSQGIYKERGSRFLAFAYPVFNEEEIKSIQKQLRREYHDARHHAYAFRLGAGKKLYRAGDDGEPSGSSGMPIFGVIQSNDLTNILIIVVRYFGGTKLGIPGLINAYRMAATDAIVHSDIVTDTEKDRFIVEFPYSSMNTVMKMIKEMRLEPISQQFDNLCRITLDIRKRDSSLFSDKMLKTEGLQIIEVKH